MLTVAPAALALASVLLAQEFDTAGGGRFSVDAALARGPVVLVFWNSWLPDSTASIPVLREIEREARTHGWPGAIVVFQDENEAAWTALGAEDQGLPRVMDRRGTLLRRFQVTRAPALLVIDRGGRVISRSGLDRAEAQTAIRSLAERH
jgi:thiol-disulfide isomerase/thioredoxin